MSESPAPLPFPDSLCHRCAAPPRYVRTGAEHVHPLPAGTGALPAAAGADLPVLPAEGGGRSAAVSAALSRCPRRARTRVAHSGASSMQATSRPSLARGRRDAAAPGEAVEDEVSGPRPGPEQRLEHRRTACGSGGSPSARPRPPRRSRPPPPRGAQGRRARAVEAARAGAPARPRTPGRVARFPRPRWSAWPRRTRRPARRSPPRRRRRGWARGRGSWSRSPSVPPSTTLPGRGREPLGGEATVGAHVLEAVDRAPGRSSVARAARARLRPSAAG